DLFPSSRFRLAYDVLAERQPGRAAKDYLRILHLAAQESEAGVEAALVWLSETGGPLDAAAVAARSRQCDRPVSPTEVTVGPVDLSRHDAFLDGKEVFEGGEGR